MWLELIIKDWFVNTTSVIHLLWQLNGHSFDETHFFTVFFFLWCCSFTYEFKSHLIHYNQKSAFTCLQKCLIHFLFITAIQWMSTRGHPQFTINAKLILGSLWRASCSCAIMKNPKLEVKVQQDQTGCILKQQCMK